jgi:siderophore synthetase component
VTDETTGSREAVLKRLWLAVRREPLPGVASRQQVGGDVLVKLSDGRMMIGPDLAPFAVEPRDLRIRLQDTAYADPAELLKAMKLPVDTTKLEAELADSVHNLDLARQARQDPDISRLQGDAQGLAVMEQSVVDGHPLHPCCRTRTGMSDDEVRRYAPEHHPTVDLPIWEVPRNRWYTTGAGMPPRLPVHPWQAEHFEDLLRQYGLKPTKDTVRSRPLMSLRTLASVNDPSRHYKTAIGVQMTSAVRQVSPAAVNNGPKLTDLLSRMTREIRVFTEVAAGAVLDDEGRPEPMLAAVIRRAPLPGPGDIWTPVAALTRPPILRQAIELGYGGHALAFWRDLVGVLVPPVLDLLHRGVGLEAHGQNLMVRLAYGRPAETGYRDVGGIKIHSGRLKRGGFDPPQLAGVIATDDEEELRAKPFATLFSVVLAEIAERLDDDPATLWRLVDEHVEQADNASDRRALRRATLPVKATTAMRLADDPVHDLWTPVPNPLSGE